MSAYLRRAPAAHQAGESAAPGRLGYDLGIRAARWPAWIRMNEIESAQLLARCQAARLPQREAAFEELGRLLYAVAWRRVAGRPELEHLAEDCMQEALLIVWQRLEAGQGPMAPERFIGWCVTILLNKLREHLRRLEPRGLPGRTMRVGLSRLTSLDAPVGEDGGSLGQRLGDGTDDLETQQAYREIQALVREIGRIDAISEASRRVLLEGYIGGLDDDELAASLGTSRANVHVIRHRDLAKLRRFDDYMRRLAAWYRDG